jgi:myo-inositol-1(or 4)-monophosphatase
MEELTSIISCLNELNLKAGAILRRYYGSRIEVEIKADQSPVTDADREVEIYLRDSLKRLFPGYSIYGEEFGEERGSSAYRWIIDPIDGTRSFILRTPLFGTLIALERDGVPILGSIYLPIQNQLMIGSAETGTFLNGQRCSVSLTSDLSAAQFMLTDPAVLATEDDRYGMRRLARRAEQTRGFGDCYGYFLVASGVADIMIDPAGLQYYDLAPIPPIIAGAGGCFTSIDGTPDLGAGSGLATNGILHDEVLRVLRGAE